MKTTSPLPAFLLLALALLPPLPAAELTMDQMWGDAEVQPGLESSDRVALFRDGNYGMFIHFGIYSHLAGQWKGETFYGIGEWIKRQMKISEADYMAEARNFNPTAFDAKEIVRVAQAAGMKWIIISSKHHDGFAMFKSKHPFNIVGAAGSARVGRGAQTPGRPQGRPDPRPPPQHPDRSSP
jgi:alpha-L-fucosidase